MRENASSRRFAEQEESRRAILRRNSILAKLRVAQASFCNNDVLARRKVVSLRSREETDRLRSSSIATLRLVRARVILLRTMSVCTFPGVSRLLCCSRMRREKKGAAVKRFGEKSIGRKGYPADHASRSFLSATCLYPL